MRNLTIGGGGGGSGRRRPMLFGLAVLLDHVVVRLLRFEHAQEGAQREDGLPVPLENLGVQRFAQHFSIQVRRLDMVRCGGRLALHPRR